MIAISVGPAHAENVDAEALFNEGNQLIAAGEVAQACEAFEASNRAESRAGTLIHLGACREQNHQLASAWSAYKNALTRAKDPDKRKLAAARVAAIEPRLSYLIVSVSTQSQTEGLTLLRNGASFDPSVWGRVLPVDGGEYVIAGRAPGHRDWRTTAHVAVERDRVRVEVPRLDPISPPAPRSPSGGLTMRRKIAIGATGASLIGLAAAGMLGFAAREDQTSAYQRCPDPTSCLQAAQANALIQSGHERAFEANLAIGAAAASLVAAAVLWVTGAPSTETFVRVSIVPSLKPGESGVTLTRSF